MSGAEIYFAVRVKFECVRGYDTIYRRSGAGRGRKRPVHSVFRACYGIGCENKISAVGWAAGSDFQPLHPRNSLY